MRFFVTMLPATENTRFELPDDGGDREVDARFLEEDKETPAVSQTTSRAPSTISRSRLGGLAKQPPLQFVPRCPLALGQDRLRGTAGRDLRFRLRRSGLTRAPALRERSGSFLTGCFLRRSSRTGGAAGWSLAPAAGERLSRFAVAPAGHGIGHCVYR